jgi:hypothetical protein
MNGRRDEINGLERLLTCGGPRRQIVRTERQLQPIRRPLPIQAGPAAIFVRVCKGLPT